MKTDQNKLRRTASELLTSGRIEVVLGYGRGCDPLIAAPLQATRPEQTDELIFDPTCGFNLATFLLRLKGRRVAVVTKGCDERSLVALIQERQIDRESLVILGAPCPGVLAPRTVEKRLDGETATEIFWHDGVAEIVLRSGRVTSIKIEELVHASCRLCPVRNPRLADCLIGEPVTQPPVPEFDPEMENLSAASRNMRWAMFRREMSKCLLCYACRNVCPACYCPQCFADSTQPKWMTRTDDPSDAMFFHLGRLLHLAGRCTGCGACERACPAGVRLGLYTARLRKDVKELFGFEAGMDPAAESPLGCFRPEDGNTLFR